MNDRDAILLRIGGSVATAIVTGYYPEDVNLDGEVKYTAQPVATGTSSC